jgi:hypothetical protein
MIGLVAIASSTSVEAFVARAVRGELRLPALAAVQEASVRALELPGAEDAGSWAARSRWRGLVPRIEAHVGTDADQSLRDGTTVLFTEARGLGVDVGARWELGDVVFNDAELRANRERIARAARIALVRDRATDLYFDRLAVELALRESPTVELILEAARLDGLLRSITGGLLEVRP